MSKKIVGIFGSLVSAYQAVKLMEDTDDGEVWGKSWMLYVAQAICGSVSHAIDANLGDVRPYWGPMCPTLALGLLLGVEELQSFRYIGTSPRTSR